MVGREKIVELLNQIEKDLKELEITYEQYFLGIEKRSPEQQRSKFTTRMRKLVALYIPQTDLRYRLNSIASRFNSYCGYWDRIQRLIEEGKYERHTSRIQRRAGDMTATTGAPGHDGKTDSVDNLYEQLVQAHQSCQMRPPDREQVASFLAKQAETIKQRFGDKQVDFVVVTEAGKPKVRVRAKD
jgi:dsDNA-binding SOS-regulon protein